MKSSSVEQLILDLYAQHSTEEAHFTAQEVYHHIKPRLPSVNQSTIYRALERMTRAGKVSVSDMGLGAAVYEAVGNEHHHHLVCQECGRVQTIKDESVGRLFRQIERENNFEVLTNHLVLFGRCHACRSKSDPD
ncbi:MAG: transcriptional repressor [Anaerolineales bacterium]|nr:transcriptional repressor [Anaerolineales bacterium]